MKKITFIPAKNSLKSTGKLKVAAYCRVSTERESQQSSISLQIRYYTDLIQNNSEWELAGIFMIMKADLEKRNAVVWMQCFRKRIEVKLITSSPNLSVDYQEMY